MNFLLISLSLIPWLSGLLTPVCRGATLSWPLILLKKKAKSGEQTEGFELNECETLSLWHIALYPKSCPLVDTSRCIALITATGSALAFLSLKRALILLKWEWLRWCLRLSFYENSTPQILQVSFFPECVCLWWRLKATFEVNFLSLESQDKTSLLCSYAKWAKASLL